MNVITRDEWGAKPPRPDCTVNRDLHTATLAVVHYSDVVPPAAGGAALAPPFDAAFQVKAIQEFHMEVRGWCDIAYHWLISPGGAVFEGRPVGVVGAHCLGHNTGSVGYCLLTDGVATSAAKSALVERIHADRAPLGGPYERVAGHRELTSTACPGDEIAAWVRDGLPVGAPPLPGPPPAPVPCRDLPPGPGPAGVGTLQAGMHGHNVALLQSALAAAGFPPAGSLRADGKWDGVFGVGTTGAVAALQASDGLLVDGIAGAQVWCALGRR